MNIINLIGVFSDPKRDPRGHNLSIAFLCEPLTKTETPIAKDDALSVEIVQVSEIESLKLAFDHIDIIIASRILKN